MVRTFLAIDLPTKLLDRIGRYQSEWSSLGSGVRWVKHSRLHVTLKFLGDIPEPDVDQVIEACQEACSRSYSFNLSIRGTGVFPNERRPRVLWIGLHEDTDHLSALHKRLEGSLDSRGYPRESRPFSPHLTVGRVKGSRVPSSALETFLREEIMSEPFPVEELIVYKSKLTPRGPLYSDLARIKLCLSQTDT